MAGKIFLVIFLFSALCFGQSKPTEVKPPPPPVAHWFNTKPEPPRDVIQYMIDHSDVVFEMIHNSDQMYCEHGPTNSDQEPMVKRCDGAI